MTTLDAKIRFRTVVSEPVEREERAFGVHDAKGREIGHAVTIIREVREADEAAHMLCDPEAIGEAYVVRPHAQRDGEAFGAIPVRSTRRAATLEEARKIREAIFAKAEKAARKKAAS